MIRRFSRAERWVHRSTAALLITCLITAFVLYNGSVSIAVGHRQWIELVHVYCGLALPVPMIAGLASPAYRADLRRLNRFSAVDRAWLRTAARRGGRLAVGKFNAGQKLNSWLSAGSILVLFCTGQLMYFTGLAPLVWRTGATFVHDWFALGLALLVGGHLYRAVLDPEARRGMRHGSVSRSWARAEHPAWAAGTADADTTDGAEAL
jgi:formate dehydrogenase subunit gamma